jgi:hypothetical protein
VRNSPGDGRCHDAGVLISHPIAVDAVARLPALLRAVGVLQDVTFPQYEVYRVQDDGRITFKARPKSLGDIRPSGVDDVPTFTVCDVHCDQPRGVV